LRGISGRVGSNLAKLLARAGIKKIVGSYWQNLKRALEIAEVLKRENIFLEIGILSDQDFWRFVKESLYHILSFNSAGKSINTRTINWIRPRILIGGGENNQLGDPREELGDKLFNKGVFYFPDFVINFGGLRKVCGELDPQGYNHQKVTEDIERIARENANKIFDLVQKEGIPSHRLAQELPRRALFEVRQKKIQPQSS
jgi:glutamate dehydrogenase/leucine dehydrogenase